MPVKLATLNKEQREAVLHIDGPIVVVAGAGTGKTRTIVYRTANLIESGIPPPSILAITFTNKAAREMRERISAMIGREKCGEMTISTIHSLCVRILRQEISTLGREPSFTICDSSDQAAIVRRALRDNNFNPEQHDPRNFLSRISAVKSIFPPVDELSFNDPVFAIIYKAYQTHLEKNNLLDFDDLLSFAARALEDKKICLKWSEKYRYVMVDEFQDVNDIQYYIVRRLVSAHKNIYVVGDDDQSIYGWRGAVVDNILNFEHIFTGAKIVKLERNYRCTGNILRAATEVIANNSQRRPKTLWTEAAPGDPITIIEVENESIEADAVVSRIMAEHTTSNRNYGDFAILYRTNAQSRPFEEKLMALGMRYIMVGGTKFYERKEVKDMNSYFRVAHNHEDEEALLRIINFPPRGIGKTTKDKLLATAVARGVPLLDVLREASTGDTVSRKAADGIRSLLAILDNIKASSEGPRLANAARELVAALDIKNVLENTNSDKNEAARRFENVEEWVNAVTDYCLSDTAPSLAGFMEHVTLSTDERELDTELREDAVTLMTVHSAKGLEFKYVFIAGVEQNNFPHERSIAEGGIEEERRLFYVAMTRARKKLFLTFARNRRRMGESFHRRQSMFIAEIPDSTVTWEGNAEMAAAQEIASQMAEERGLSMLAALFDD